jgi:hypothetical protein
MLVADSKNPGFQPEKIDVLGENGMLFFLRED